MQFDRSWSLTIDPGQFRDRAVDVGRRRAAHLGDGSRDVHVSCDRYDDADIIRLTRQVPTGARGPAAAVVGRFLPMVQTERWRPPDRTGAVTGQLRVLFPHRPITLIARLRVTPTADGCVQQLTGRVEARTPGVGRLLEHRIVTRMLADLDRQLAA